MLNQKPRNILFDLIMDKDLLMNRWPQAINQQKKREHQSTMVEVIDKQMFENLKNRKSKGGWTLARAINTGTLYQTSLTGCHAGDLESYHLFKEFFYPVIQKCHKGFKLDGSMHHITDLDSQKINTNLGQSAVDKIASTRVRCSRNFKMFPLNTLGTKQSRMQILELMEKAISMFPENMAGKLLKLDEISQEQIQDLVDKHYLFRPGDKMQAASGYYNYWPIGRAIFISNDCSFMIWINEGDHNRYISMQKGANIKQVFARFSYIITTIEKVIKQILKVDEIYLSDPILGKISCCPTNLGTCMRSSTHIAIPKLVKKMGFEQLDRLTRTMNCQARGTSGEHSEVKQYVDISNFRRLGFKQYQLIEDMIKCVNYLSKIEDQILQE